MNNYEMLLKELQERLKKAETEYSSKKEAYADEDRTIKLELTEQKNNVVELTDIIKRKKDVFLVFRSKIKDCLKNIVDGLPLTAFTGLLAFIAALCIGGGTPIVLIMLLVSQLINFDFLENIGDIFHIIWIRIWNSEEKLEQEITMREEELGKLNSSILNRQTILDSHSSELYKLEGLIHKLNHYISFVSGSLEEVRCFKPTTEEKFNEYYRDDMIVERVAAGKYILPIEVGMLRERSFRHVRRENNKN